LPDRWNPLGSRASSERRCRDLPAGQKYKTLELRQIEPLQVEAIRELKARADTADARADRAEARAKAQDDRIQALEDARRPVITMNPSGAFIGLGLVALSGALVFTRRKRSGSGREG
jgi:LPXTG-motif cell wall-anchored protein